MKTGVLHVANGHCTTGAIELSGVPGRTMVWCDPLDEGPVPDVTDEELIRIRAAFLAAADGDVADVAADLGRWRSAVDDHASYSELVLWFEHDLFDQLNLIQLLSHLGRNGPPARPVTLISIDRFPGHPGFQGLGELSPGDLATLFPSRKPLVAEQYAVARRAWQAFRSPDPRALDALVATDTSALPFLDAALRRHLEEFPSERNGLSRSEQRLLDLAGAGGHRAVGVWRAMHEAERALYLTDMQFKDRVTALASATPALISLVASTHDDSWWQNTCQLTDAGRSVVGGTADRIRLCGIDRWLGGVHLAGTGTVWRWSDAAGRLIEA